MALFPLQGSCRGLAEALVPPLRIGLVLVVDNGRQTLNVGRMLLRREPLNSTSPSSGRCQWRPSWLSA